MKKLSFFFIAALFISLTGIAQVSESINYQAVARNNAGAALANQTIKVRFTILRNAVTQYSETRQVITNALGLFNVQIGSAGALTTTGTFNTIDWKNNTPNMLLKVELDINNTNVFTDMGSQAFSSVPFAFAAETAVEPVNIAGRPIDQTTTPTIGSRLSWNGTKWAPVKKDTVIKVLGTIPTISPLAGNPWQWVGPFKTITVNGSETIVVDLAGVLGHTSSQVGFYGISVCYQNVSGGQIINADGADQQQNIYLPASKNIIPVINALRLPAGTYNIGMGIKHIPNGTAPLVTLNYNDILNGVIEVKY